MIFVESPSLRNNCDEIIMNYDELWWIILNLRQLQADGNRSAQCETFDVPSLRNDGPGWELKPRCRMLIDLSTHQCAKRMLQSMKMRPLYPNEPGKKTGVSVFGCFSLINKEKPSVCFLGGIPQTVFNGKLHDLMSYYHVWSIVYWYVTGIYTINHSYW